MRLSSTAKKLQLRVAGQEPASAALGGNKAAAKSSGRVIVTCMCLRSHAATLERVYNPLRMTRKMG